MSKKMILVGMRRDSACFAFFNIVINQLSNRSIDVIDIDRDRFRFKTPNTEVWFVNDYYCKYFLDGVRPDAIFGELYPELQARAQPHTTISSRDHIGLVDYIDNIERDMDVVSMYPKSIFISTARKNGRAMFQEAFKRYLNGNNVPYVEISKGENLMTQEEKIYIQQDVSGIMKLADAMKDLHKRTLQRKLFGIKNVIFSGPCTIVLWEDGTKTVVRCDKDVLDPEKGLAMAIAKKALGTNKSGSNYYDIFKKWLPKEETEEVTE